MKSQTVDVTESQFRGHCAHLSSPALYFEEPGALQGGVVQPKLWNACGRK